MMSNISDERLIVAAVKGDCQAMDELKDRALYGQYGINTTLKKRKCSDAEIKLLEPHIVEMVFDDLHTYGFSQPFHIYGYRLSLAMSHSSYKNDKDAQRIDKENLKDKVVPNAATLYSSAEPKHPPLEEIDLEIRRLVSLLNRSPDMKTGTSCSGHPTTDYDPYGGYLILRPIGSPHKTVDFLVGLLMRLDNSSTVSNAEAIIDRYKEVDAEELYYSGVPIVVVNISFSFYVCHREEKDRLEIWKHLIACIKELIPIDEELTTEVSTPEIAMQLLQKALQNLPFLFSSTLVTSQEGYLGIVLSSVADLAVCQWFSTLASQLNVRLDKAGYTAFPDAEGAIPFAEKWVFRLRPFLNQELIPLPHLLTPQWEPRTREDHLKIWKLLENTVAEQLEHEGVNTA